MSRSHHAAMTATVALLVTIGLAAALGRGAFPKDFTMQIEPVRAAVMNALGREDPYASQRPAELVKIERRYAAHPVMTYVHVTGGAAFLLLASLQFSSRIRARFINFHRWSGRTLLFIGTATTLGGLFFGIFVPYAGKAEAIVIALAGGCFLTALMKGALAIRRKEVAVHREWMIRAFAIAIGISTVRLVGAVVDFTLTPMGLGLAEGFVLSLWLGWLMTAGVAELWIARTRDELRREHQIHARGVVVLTKRGLRAERS